MYTFETVLKVVKDLQELLHCDSRSYFSSSVKCGASLKYFNICVSCVCAV